MRNINKALILFCFSLTLGVVQFIASESMAQSSYFTSRGCINCHLAPVVATCNGCHHHGNSSLAAVTNKTSYAPGETVSATLSGGSRSGWIRAILYNQAGVQVAISNGNASGMGGSTTFPAALTAPAPTTPGSYTWKMAYFGNQDGTGTGDVHSEVTVNTNSFTVVAPADTTVPVVSVFTLPATATSLTVPVSAFTASDNVAVTGYLITTSSTAPAASAAGWSATAPASVTAVAGANTFYAWAKDAAGNVSAAKSAAVTVTLPDTAAPVVNSFTLPATATSLTVSVSAFTATDNVGVTGYLITTSSTAPAASAAGWSATAPASVTAVAGANTFYAWAKDAAGNVSAVKSAAVTVTLPDAIAPVVTFTLPATATSLTVSVSAFTATDNVGVTGYLITTSSTAPAASAAGWSATAPASVTAVAGANTFYAWAKDAAGNVSAVKSAAVTVTLPDAIAPVVTFTLPATATNLTVLVSTFTATDNVGVTGYLITTSSTAPAASAAGWSATAPASVIAVAGANTFYAWAKDAAGNVSAVKSAAVTVTLPDAIVPVVNSFTLPATAATLTVPVSAFTATDNVGVTGYLINKSASAPAASAAGWSATAPASVTAVAGANTFYAWAKDAAGNVSLSKSASVTITTTTTDTTKPTLTISALANGAYTNKPTLNISGIATDAGGLQSVTVNGQAVVLGTDGSFSTALNLTVGANTVSIVATDKAGNQQTDTRTITYDATAPLLTVTAPADNSSSAQSFITLTGTISENSTVTVTNNGGSLQSASISGNSFTATVNLASGVNTLVITATDLAGNSSTAKRTITHVAGNLTLAVTYPSQDITTRRSTLALTGTIADATSKVTVSVKMDGHTYRPSVINGTFKQNLSFTRAKTYTITVTATDAAGNTSSVSRNVIYRPTERDDEHNDD